MCSLQKLSVQGIRSFSPDQPQVIKFYPLTVILGPNGSGKTTLIECLRYASSGETPPNSNKGKTWVHDPQLSKKSHTIHGQVKLKFTDASKDKVETVIARPLELQLTRDKNNKVSAKIRTLGAAIKRGDTTYANAKCVDVETEMLTFLGVSKAVLTNVIFCHQEDSNWPLSDGKILKEKFDAIFGSEGYVKVLKKIKDVRKNRLDEQKLKQQQLMLYSEHKERYEKNEQEYQQQQDELAKLKVTARKVDEDLIPLRQKLSEIEVKERSYYEFENKISNMRVKLKEQKRSRDDIEGRLYEPFNGNREQLKEEIRNFENNLQRKQLETHEIAKKIFEIEEQIRLVTENKNEMLQLKGKLDLMKDDYLCNLQRRVELIEKVVNEENIADNVRINEKEYDIHLFMKCFNDRINQLNEESSQTLNCLDSVIVDLQSQLEKQKIEKHTLELSSKNEEKLINSKKLEKQTLEENLRLSNVSGAKMIRLRNEIKAKKSDVESLKNSVSLDTFNNSLNSLNLSKSKANAELENLNTSMRRMQSESVTRTQMKVLQENKLKEEENVSEIFGNNLAFMKTLNIKDAHTEKSVYTELSILIQKLSCELNSLKSELNSLEKEKSKCEALYKVENTKYQDCMLELEEKKKTIQRVCESRLYSDFLNAVKEEDKLLREKYSSLENSKFIWNDIINDIKREQQCVICCRSFEKDNQMHVAITNIKKRIESCPTTKTLLESEMKRTSELLEKLNSLRATNERVNKLPKLIEQAKTAVDEHSDKLCGLRYSIEARTQTCIEKTKEIDTLKSFEKNAVEFDRSLQVIKDVEIKITKLSQKMSSDSNGVQSVDDLRDDVEKKAEEIKGYEKEIERINRKKNEYIEQLNSLQTDVNDLEGELLLVEKDQLSSVGLEKKISEIIGDISKAEENIKQLKQKVDVTDKNIEELENKLYPRRKNRQMEEQRFRLKMTDVQYVYKEVESLNTLIDSYVKERKGEKLCQVQSDIKKMEEQLTRLSEQRMSCLNRREVIQKEVSEGEIRQRNLEDNARLFDYNEEIKKLEASIKTEEFKFGSADIDLLKRQKMKISEDISSQTSRKDRALSLQTPLLTRMRTLEDEMKLDKYKKAKDNFRKKQLEVITESIICEDLDKYYKALDHSVMAYHQKKMEDINKLIFKLWKQTYRGGDIEYIKIAFDENEERSASDRKRSFNYRVVMVKEGGVELDMRGRCSAGQKVLASLVIRLALAEIFCINCGILALDEPTTNLDNENIQSFANAVTEIVKSHKKLNNFQMIIITHDEQFLKCLDEESDEYYYRVFKEDGYSKIKQCSLKERE